MTAQSCPRKLLVLEETFHPHARTTLPHHFQEKMVLVVQMFGTQQRQDTKGSAQDASTECTSIWQTVSDRAPSATQQQEAHDRHGCTTDTSTTLCLNGLQDGGVAARRQGKSGHRTSARRKATLTTRVSEEPLLLGTDKPRNCGPENLTAPNHCPTQGENIQNTFKHARTTCCRRHRFRREGGRGGEGGGRGEKG